jgi:hypothetical protein
VTGRDAAAVGVKDANSLVSESGGGSAVLVDDAAEAVVATDLADGWSAVARAVAVAAA